MILLLRLLFFRDVIVKDLVILVLFFLIHQQMILLKVFAAFPAAYIQVNFVIAQPFVPIIRAPF